MHKFCITLEVTPQLMDWLFSAAKKLAKARFGGINGSDAGAETA